MLYILVLVIIIIIYSQHKHINKVPKDIEILQFNNPEKEKFEQIVSNKQPSVFTNVLDHVILNNQNIHTYFDFYLPSMCLKNKYIVDKLIKNQESQIKRQSSYRKLIYQIQGVQKIILFPPTNSKHLYLDKTNQFSNVNFWNLKPQIYPDFNQAKYLEIILRPRQMIYIPHGWFYTFKVAQDGDILSSDSESVFSFLLKKNKI